MHLRLRKCEKLPQTYHKLANLRLRNNSCSFAVAKLSTNLRCPALPIGPNNPQTLFLKARAVIISKDLEKFSGDKQR